MEKLSILMTKEMHAKWSAEHPLGSPIDVSVGAVRFSGTVSEFASYHEKIEVRVRLK